MGDEEKIKYKTENGNDNNGNQLSHRSFLSGSHDKGSLKALVRVSPKL